MNLDYYRSFVKDVLTPQRFQHSLGVMQVMGELASVYRLDQSTALVIGLLHDATKDIEAVQQLQFAQKANIPLYETCDRNPLYLHGPVSAYLIAKELDITDMVILDTISRHSYYGYGEALSPSFCWCLRFADMLEPQRDWEAIKSQLQPVVYAGRMEEGARLQLEWLIPFLEGLDLPVHPNMRRIHQELSASLNEKKTTSEHRRIPC